VSRVPLTGPRLEEGMYVLKQDVRNPRPNRSHRHDWTYAEVWKAGKYAVVNKDHDRPGLQVIVRFNDYAIHCVGTHTPGGQLLLAHMEKADPLEVTDVTYLSEAMGRSIRSHEILQHFVDSGLVSLDLVKEAEDLLYRRERAEMDGAAERSLADRLNEEKVVLDGLRTVAVSGAFPDGVRLSPGDGHAYEERSGKAAHYDCDLGRWADVR